MSGQAQQQDTASHGEIVEMVSGTPPMGRRRSARASSPQGSWVLPNSGSSTTILIRSASRTRPPEPPPDADNGKKVDHRVSTSEIDHDSKVSKEENQALIPPRSQPYLRLGSTELARGAVWQCSLVEFAVSLILTFVSVAAVIACLKAQFSFPRIAVAVTQFLVYTVCILAAAPVSGGHLNPSFSFATMLTGHTSFVRSALYILAQSTGSVFGAYFVKLVVSSDVSQAYSLGGCLLKQRLFGADEMLDSFGADPGPGFVSEVIFTFLLISVAFPFILEYSNATHFGDPRLVRGAFITGLLLGLLIFVSGELLAPGYTSAGMNPARCFGPAVAEGGEALWQSQWVFWVGPLLAGLIFAFLYRLVHWRPYTSSIRTAETQPRIPVIGDPASVTETNAPRDAAPSAETTAANSTDPSRPIETNTVTIASSESQPNGGRRMDVFLHIKAMMHKPENNQEKDKSASSSLEREIEDVELQTSLEQPSTSLQSAFSADDDDQP